MHRASMSGTGNSLVASLSAVDAVLAADLGAAQPVSSVQQSSQHGSQGTLSAAS